MIIFLLTATLMVAIGLAFILAPMLGRGQKTTRDRRQLNTAIYRERLAELERQHRDRLIDEAELARARSEIQRAALLDLAGADPARTDSGGNHTPAGTRADRTAALLIALAMPAAGFGLYFQWGNPELLATGAGHPMPPARHAGLQPPASSSDPPALEDMVARLAARLRQQPDDPRGWLMLGRSYTVMGRIEEAGAAFAEAYRQRPDDPEVLVGYAESLAGHNDGDMAGQPADLIRSALGIDPDFPAALWLAGMAAYQRNDYHRAIEHWERLRKGGKISEREQGVLTEILAEARRAAETGKDAD